MSEADRSPDRRDGPDADPDAELGGDAPCFAPDVCAECGLLIEDRFADTCPRCGTPRS